MSVTPLPAPAQRMAIEAPLGPTLVIAGPGAGKTFCLIARVEHLIVKHGFAPSQLCAVTFTNKAAEEIATRLTDTLGQRAADVTRGTLHALCAGILREHGTAIDVPRGFGIADEAYQHRILRRMGVHRSRWFNLLTLFGRRRLQSYALSADDETLFVRYHAILQRRNLLDFDDLIGRTAELFRDHPDVADRVGARWRCVLVDEFQDLNESQYYVLTQLAQSHNNFFAVGDEEQSIFSWTGADPTILVRFQRDYEIPEPIVLDSNHRCSRQIFDAARLLLSANPSLFHKELRADKDSPFAVTAYAFPDDSAERDWILSDIATDRQAEPGLRWGDYAILYRRHQTGRALEQRMVREGIPCRLARGRSLADDPVIRFVVASLRLVSQPGDPIAVEVFAEQVLPESLLAHVRAAVKEDEDLIQALRAFARTRPKTDPDAKKAWRFVYHVENLGALHQSHTTLAGLVEELLAQRVGKYSNVLEEHHDELTDPAAEPAAGRLADRLRTAMAANARVVVTAPAGLDIALRGMLRAVGVSTARSERSHNHPTAPHDLVIGLGDGGPLGLAVTLFKALQLIQSRDFEDVFESYVAFDLETTDKDVSECEIVEIGAVKVQGGQVVDRFHSLVRTDRPISSGASEVHGYEDADLVNAPRFAEVWPRFRDFVGDQVAVAHNGQRFDVPVLRRSAAGLDGADGLVFFDTLPLARSLYQDSARLVDLAARFGVEMGRAHHAMDDAETLAAVFHHLGRQKVVRSRKSILVNLLDYLGLALALEGGGDAAEETQLLSELARPYALGRFSDCLEFYAGEANRDTEGDVPSVDEVIRRMGGKALMDRIRATRSAAQRYPLAMARLRALIEASARETLDDGIRAFLERVVLSTSEGADVDLHRVNLLTLHSTKGLEFSRVYIVGVEDYQLPGYYAVRDARQSDIEEARRLLYVGMTRARDRLVLTRAASREGKDTGGSRFLEEMGLEPVDVAGQDSPSLP